MKKIFDFAHVVSFISQIFFSFATPVGIWLLIGYLLTEKAGAGSWAMVLSVILGAVCGVVSMFKYIIAASRIFEENKVKNEQPSGRADNSLKNNSKNCEKGEK
jgi:F0F1-type ATP synthase assembly protein I